MAATALATATMRGGAFAETAAFNAAGLGAGDIARPTATAAAVAAATGPAIRLLVLVRLAILIVL